MSLSTSLKSQTVVRLFETKSGIEVIIQSYNDYFTSEPQTLMRITEKSGKYLIETLSDAVVIINHKKEESKTGDPNYF